MTAAAASVATTAKKPKPDVGAIPALLLDWYDVHGRELPWRVGPAARAAGEEPDPYRVWLSEIMLQQTTVATVRPRFDDFLSRWPTVEALAAAPVDDVLGAWAGLGYYARARNLHKCAQVVANEFNGRFPETEEALLKLPGVGPYTAAAIAAIAFDAPAVVVDGNIERVTARLFAIETPVKEAKAEIRNAAGAIWPAARSGDFAQGLMDLGAGVCGPRAPSCLICPLAEECAARANGDPARLPVKAPKAQKPLRFGVAYALFNGRGEVLLEKRPDKGLLGGMLGLPGAPWTEGKAAEEPPVAAEWRSVGTVSHTFTHFHLALEVMRARAPKGYRRPASARWTKPDAARLPTVMGKALDAALNS